MQDKLNTHLEPPADSTVVAEAPPKELTPAAQRALAEATERRAAQDAKAAELARIREINGRNGPDPVRYTDWETKGIATDF